MFISTKKCIFERLINTDNNLLNTNFDMTYKIIDIQGIGPVYAEKLIGIGIETVDQLLEKGADAKGRQAIEEATGIRHDLVLTWVNHADLFRVKGVGPQFSELLEAAGVDTVVELANRKPENLVAKLNEVNEAKKLVRRVPALVEVEKMIAQAKKLDRVVSY